MSRSSRWTRRGFWPLSLRKASSMASRCCVSPDPPCTARPMGLLKTNTLVVLVEDHGAERFGVRACGRVSCGLLFSVWSPTPRPAARSSPGALEPPPASPLPGRGRVSRRMPLKPPPPGRVAARAPPAPCALARVGLDATAVDPIRPRAEQLLQVAERQFLVVRFLEPAVPGACRLPSGSSTVLASMVAMGGRRGEDAASQHRQGGQGEAFGPIRA